LRKSLMRRPANAREVVLFVHGYYTNFAYGVMRVAQLDHDLKYPGAVTHFSWPSAGRPLGYGYDRDSVLFSRDALESYIRDLAKTGVRVLLVGHSMGAQLSVEAIRQIELKTPGWSKRNLSGVVLLSPDIDIDVFRSQTSAIAQMPEPFIIFVSDKDRVLDLSAFITGERERLGNLSDASRLSEIQVTLMDVTNFNNGLGHFNVGTSEGLMSILRELPQLDSTFAGNVTGGETFRYGAVMTIQNVTSIILSPISALP
ncbi:MAG: alpha/beta fold hydrolase, partial [Boseongicola sp.]|nr:alpha/beta fold hydrolase [Boseongicola sp.]